MPVRGIRSADLPSVAKLAAELGYPATLEDFEARFELLRDSPADAILVAELTDGTVAGWIYVSADPTLTHDPIAEIKALVVGALERGRGLGTELVEAAQAWCVGRGLRSIRVRSRVERERAHSFYRRLGYSDEKTQRVFLRPVDESRTRNVKHET